MTRPGQVQPGEWHGSLNVLSGEGPELQRLPGGSTTIMRKITAIIIPLVLCGCAAQLTGVGHQPTAEQTAGGLFISWREHLIDDPRTSGVEFSGSDGAVMGDVDGDMDFVSTRGNSYPFDGVFWMEQVRSKKARPAFTRARSEDSEEMPLPLSDF